MKPIDRTEITTLAIAGLIGEITFEAYAWLVSPIIFGVKLEPANLVIGLTKTFTGLQIPYAMAFVIHFLIGAFGFAAIVFLFKRIGNLSYLAAGVGAGFALWFVAQGMLAPLMGRSFMMGFGTYTQSSLIGHVGMTVVMALLWKTFLGRHTALAT